MECTVGALIEAAFAEHFVDAFPYRVKQFPCLGGKE